MYFKFHMLNTSDCALGEDLLGDGVAFLFEIMFLKSNQLYLHGMLMLGSEVNHVLLDGVLLLDQGLLLGCIWCLMVCTGKQSLHLSLQKPLFSAENMWIQWKMDLNRSEKDIS